MKSLILVDIQNDFCPGGALPVTDGQQVVEIANQLIPKFEMVVATQDWHPKNHKSFASQNEGVSVGELFKLNGSDQVAWPDHCIQGTPGAEFVADLNMNAVTKVFAKGTNQDIDSYSGFFDNDHNRSTGMGEYLKTKNVTDVYVLGLATDYCVKFTVLDAIDLGLKVKVVIDGCRGAELNDGDVAIAIEEMKTAGVEIICSDEVKDK